MRRTLAAALLGISLWIGSLAWSGFLLTKTVLDPGRSEAVADALYEDEAVRDQLADNMAGAIQAALPDNVDVAPAVLERAARTALASPAVETVVKDAFVRSHQAFLGAGEAPESLNAGAFGAAARDALVDQRPDLDDDLPPAPRLEVPLPTDRIPNLGPVREVIQGAVPVLALLAAAGSALALLITKNRPAILRRAGFWAVGLSLTVLAFAYGIPYLAQRFTPDQSEVVAALVGAMAAETRGPALVAAAAGAAGVAASFIWRAMPSVVGSFDLGGDAPVRGGPVTGPTPDGPPPGLNASQAARWYQRRDVPMPPRSRPPAEAATQGIPARRPDPDGFARRRRPSPDPHPGFPDARPVSKPQPASPGAPTSSVSQHMPDGRRIVPSSEEIPDDARWVPGVGYVVDET